MATNRKDTKRSEGLGSRISRIKIDGLFGQFNYDLKPRGGVSLSEQNLIVLYGDNGSGKTTILSLVFHLLAPQNNRSHRSFIARTPFRLLSVAFASGLVVSAERLDGTLLGSFSMRIEKKGKEIASQLFHGTEDGIPDTSALRPDLLDEYSKFCQHLADTEIAVHLLSDNRKIWSDLEPDRQEKSNFVFLTDSVTKRLVRRKKEPSSSDESGLATAIDRFLRWAQHQALLGSNVGSRNVNTIYIDIVKSIAADPKTLRSNQRKTEVTDLIETLKIQARRSKAFSDFGLGIKLSVNDLVSILETAQSQAIPTIVRVLRPYCEGITARLDALENVYNSINTFVETINRFYTFKTLKFDLSNGIQISSDNGQILSPDNLSSGEKQLLLLFCNVMSSHDKASIFIIDEPELSLNVKWQRRLVSALLSCIRGRQIQLLIATHSLELITQHKESVARLDPI